MHVHILLCAAKMSLHSERHVLPSRAHNKGGPSSSDKRINVSEASSLSLYVAQIYLFQKTTQLAAWVHGTVSLSPAPVINYVFLSQIVQLACGTWDGKVDSWLCSPIPSS